MRITKKYPSSLTLRHHRLETLFQFIKSFKKTNHLNQPFSWKILNTYN